MPNDPLDVSTWSRFAGQWGTVENGYTPDGKFVIWHSCEDRLFLGL